MTPIFPLETLSDDRGAIGVGAAVALGVAFGFVLERGGLGRAQKLAGQFYGRDMTVLRVMFTAIATATAGGTILSLAGVLDLGAVQLAYPTFLWPMIAGGLVLGAGFVVSGYCPGTALVASASGKLDGVATAAGVVVGSLLYAETEPLLGGFPGSGRLGSLTLAQLLHLPLAGAAALVIVVAVGAFALAGRVERAVNASSTAAGPAAAVPARGGELAP